jgi:hypothetical protein
MQLDMDLVKRLISFVGIYKSAFFRSDNISVFNRFTLLLVRTVTKKNFQRSIGTGLESDKHAINEVRLMLMK